MCGIAGLVHFEANVGEGELVSQARAMATAMAHRGPDDSGAWADARSGVALGHRRLSIIDLSPLGHQPMASRSERYVLVYNGEIYNYRGLADDLLRKGHSFRGHSDTEVLLAAFEEWGVPVTLERCNGMFAMALWDAKERAITFARDRFGEKPLYYGLFDRVLLFASELKALEAHPCFAGRIDRSSLAQYVRYGNVPAPRTIYEQVRKLPPASWVRIAASADFGAAPRPYWSLPEIAAAAQTNRLRLTEDDAVSQLDAALAKSVRLRMVSDVPLGAFLSGGIDSSTVVSLMQAQSPRPVRTFTIGFHEAAYNEAESAKAIAKHLGTDHTELYVTAEEARAVIPKLPMMYDEPFADSSQIPTNLVSQLARKQVTVALSGDGGDELFGGYVRYTWAEALWRPLSLFPPQARALLASSLRRASPEQVDRYVGAVQNWLPGRLRQQSPAEKVRKLAELLEAKNRDDVYLHLVSIWREPERLVRAREAPITQGCGDLPLDDFVERMMCTDAVTYLPDDILVKLDRASMAVSLETRVPMLDPDVAHLAWRIPKDMKMRDGKGKWVLREVLARYVPKELFERPKMGFGVPIGSWLRGPLRDWAEALLDGDRLSQEGFFDAALVREKWREHLESHNNWMHHLWAVLMFQAWLAERPRLRSSAWT